MPRPRLKRESLFIRGVCVECNERPQKTNGYKHGKEIFKHICSTCDKNRYPPDYSRKTKRQKIKKKHCEKCGFVAKHYAQLDIDHIDGNRNNNDPSNLQTLCANCHRLKTVKERDNLKRYSSKQ